MTVQPANPPNTAPPTLTPAQTRALLHALLSSSPPTASRPNTATPRPKAVRQQPVQQQQTITIDASTRIMGHCNNVALASPSPTEQAFRIESLVRGVLHPAASASVNLNVSIQAGVSIMGSKNVVVLNGKRDVGKDGTKGDDPFAGGKRRAESEPADAQAMLGKRVKVEA